MTPPSRPTRRLSITDFPIPIRFCEEWIEPARAAEIPNEVERTFAIIRRHSDALIASLEP